MINNRQTGRRRGRGGGGPRTPGALPNQGNRQDNRSRGNAAQLHEKYKSLARDAQLAGDRVQTEYYLQFADHYFRVLGESRARFEEQRPRRDDYLDEDEDGEEMLAGDEEQQQPQQQQPRRERFEPRREREPRFNRESRDMRPPRAPGDNEEVAPPAAANERGEEGEPRARRGRNRRFENEGGEERISLDVLPPAIAPVSAPEPGAEGEPVKPVRRRAVRRPRTEGGEEIAPAA